MSKSIQFNSHHFPAGTVFKADTTFTKGVNLTAIAVVNNGADSCCVRYQSIEQCGDASKDLPRSEIDLVNVDHVTEIIKRGDGPLVFDQVER